MSLRRSSEVSARFFSVEQLESRRLLAGVVQVSLFEGDLLIRGDELGNVFAVEQAPPSQGARGSLVIKPDAETAINDLPVGTPLDLGPVELLNVRIVPGDGADGVSLHGLSVAGNLAVRNSGGFDSLRIADLDLDGRLDIGSASPLGVHVNKTAASDMYLKVGGIKGESQGAPGSQVSITDSHFAGRLRVESSGALNLKANASSADSGYLKFDGIKGESTDAKHKDTIEIDSFSWGASLKVEASRPTELSIVNSEVGGETYLTYKLKDVIVSSYGISNSQLKGGLRVESSGIVSGTIDRTTAESASFNFPKVSSPVNSRTGNSSLQLRGFDLDGALRVESSQALDVSITDGTAAAVDVFLKIPNVKGESSKTSSLMLKNSQIDGRLAVGATGGRLDLSLVDSEVGGGTFLKINMEEPLISSYTISGAQLNGGLHVESKGIVHGKVEETTTESASLNFTKISRPGNSQLTSSSLQLSGFDVDGRLRVESSQALDLSITDGTAAAVDVFLKIPNVKGESNKSAPMLIKGVQIDGRLTVIASGGAVDANIEETSASDMYLKMGGIKGETRGAGPAGQVTITDSHFGGQLRVESSGALSLKAHASSADSGYLKFDGIKGETSDARHKNTIEIDSFSWDGNLSIQASTPTELTIENSRVGGKVYLEYKLEDVLISSYRISASTLEGGLRVETSGIVNGTIDGTTTESASFNFTKISRPGNSQSPNSSLHLSGFDVGGALRVESSQPLDLSFSEGTAGAVDVFLKLPDIKGESNKSSPLLMQGVQIGGGLTIVGSGGSEHVKLERVHADGGAKISLGGGRDSLSVIDSVFGRSTLFDGGDDFDELLLVDVDFENDPTLQNWERINGEEKVPTDKPPTPDERGGPGDQTPVPKPRGTAGRAGPHRR